MNDLPLVTVAHLCFNNAKYICESIESVQASSYLNLEHLVIDDGSNESEFELLQNFLSKDKFKGVQLHKNEVNLGIPASQNRAVELANGKYFIGAISDDIMFPEKILDDVMCLEGLDESVVAVFSVAEFFHKTKGDCADEQMGRIAGTLDCSEIVLSSEEFGRIVFEKNIIPAPTVMLRTSWLKLSPYDSTYFLEDLPKWVDLIEGKHSIVHRSKVSIYYRRLLHSYSSQDRKDEIPYRIQLDVIRCRLRLIKALGIDADISDLLRNGISILQDGAEHDRDALLQLIEFKERKGWLYTFAKVFRNRLVLRLAWGVSKVFSSKV